MNRRTLLKALAALPLVGKTITWARGERVENTGRDPAILSTPARPAHPATLPDRCPLCEGAWAFHPPWAGPSLTYCGHPCLLEGEEWVWKSPGPCAKDYIAQLRRRREMEERNRRTFKGYADRPVSAIQLTIAWEGIDVATAKINDIDRVLRFLGETP